MSCVIGGAIFRARTVRGARTTESRLTSITYDESQRLIPFAHARSQQRLSVARVTGIYLHSAGGSAAVGRREGATVRWCRYQRGLRTPPMMREYGALRELGVLAARRGRTPTPLGIRARLPGK